jgi:hypothetical protein
MMGGRGGGSAVSRNQMQADFEALRREQSQLGLQQQVQANMLTLIREMPVHSIWVPIADLRERMKMSRADFDRLIISMSVGRDRVLSLRAEDNQKTLTPHRRAGALRVGGQDEHYVRIYRAA